MRYTALFAIALAACGHAEPINHRAPEGLKFKIESDEDYDVVSVFSNGKLIAEITEVSVKDPIIYPYEYNNSAIIITDFVAEGLYYVNLQYVKISLKAKMKLIYNCHASFAKNIRYNEGDDNYHENLKNIIWDGKIKKLNVINEDCKIARPIIPGGNTF